MARIEAEIISQHPMASLRYDRDGTIAVYLVQDTTGRSVQKSVHERPGPDAIRSHKTLTCRSVKSRTMMEESAADYPQTSSKQWWKQRKRVWIAAISFAVLIVIFSVSVAAGNSRNKHIWNERPVEESSITSRFAKLTGTWDNRMVVVGYNDDDNSSVVESYKRTGNRYQKMYEFQVEGIVSSMAVSHPGHVLALAVEEPFHFLVYERSGEDWSISGESIDLEGLGLADDGVVYSHPGVMLSSDGNVLALSLQGDEAAIYVFQRSEDGGVGGQWSLRGQPIVNTHEQDHGRFATFSDMSGDGLVFLVASEFDNVSLYRFGGLKYDLHASYDESPRIGQGSLALSEDGLVFSVGSYQGFKEEMGQLHVVNDQWHWFIDDGNHEGPEVDLLRTSIETALSANGQHVVIGRYPLRTEGQDEQVATIQVYEHDPIDNEWTSRGPPFGEQPSSTMRGSVDLSGDGSLVASVMDGNVYVYEYGGK